MTVIVIFCVGTSHPQDFLFLFFFVFDQSQPLCSYKDCSHKKVYNFLGSYSGTQGLRFEALRLP